MKADQHDLKNVRDQFEKGLVETVWSERGEPSYIIQDGLDVYAYAQMAKQLLEDEKLIAHDFTGTVKNEDGLKSATFEYHSGWFLEGLAEGEIE